MRIDIMTLFPEMVMGVLGQSITGRALQDGKAQVQAHNIRDYTTDKHGHVDDTPYGGGMGMVMQCQPIFDCYKAICANAGTRPRVVFMSPQGKKMDQQLVRRYATQYPHVAILCGHYEGVDQRVIDAIVDEEISLGDFVLTGGEIAAMAFCDAVLRLQEGVLADESCYTEESHWNSLLEYPQYTKPAMWNLRPVPKVLLSGHHANIDRWRREQSIKNTLQKRPDMLQQAQLTREDRRFLQNIQCKNKNK